MKAGEPPFVKIAVEIALQQPFMKTPELADLSADEGKLIHVYKADKLIQEFGIKTHKTGCFYRSFGNWLSRKGDLVKAAYCYQQSAEIFALFLNDFPTDYCLAENSVAVLMAETGQFIEAEKHFNSVFTDVEKLLGVESHEYAILEASLASLLLNTRRFDECEATIDSAIVALAEIEPRDGRFRIAANNTLAELYFETGRVEEAIELHRDQLQILESTELGKEDSRYLSTLNNLGRALQNAGKLTEAKKCYQESIRLREKPHGKYHPELFASLNNLVNLSLIHREYTVAEQLAIQMVDVCREHFGENHPSFIPCANNFGIICLQTDRVTEAEAWFEKAKATAVSNFGNEHPPFANCLINLAAIYELTDRQLEARKNRLQALAIYESHYPEDSIYVQSTRQLLPSESEPNS